MTSIWFNFVVLMHLTVLQTWLWMDTNSTNHKIDKAIESLSQENYLSSINDTSHQTLNKIFAYNNTNQNNQESWYSWKTSSNTTIGFNKETNNVAKYTVLAIIGSVLAYWCCSIAFGLSIFFIGKWVHD